MLEALLQQIDNKEFFVWDAVFAWRDHICKSEFYNNTKSNYLTGMLKLIESGILNIRHHLKLIDECWLSEAKQKIENKPEWSQSTKSIRKSCLNRFYNFVKNDFDTTLTPYRRHPEYTEIKYILSDTEEKTKEEIVKFEKHLIHLLSNVPDKRRTIDLSPIILSNAISKINERDAYIVWLMMWTGQTLESILDRRKEHFRTSSDEETKTAYLDFEDENGNLHGKYIPQHITKAIKELSKNSKVYLLETSKGKRILRTQIMRNLKQAGHNIGLDFDLTPKVLHGYVCAYMSCDKRSELEKAMGFSIN